MNVIINDIVFLHLIKIALEMVWHEKLNNQYDSAAINVHVNKIHATLLK